MKTFRRMDRSSEAITITILISIFSLFVSDVVCISHRFESQEVEVLHHHSSHLPIQPELVRTFEHCHKRASTFDLCIKNAFNELRVYFKTGKFFSLQFLHNFNYISMRRKKIQPWNKYDFNSETHSSYLTKFIVATFEIFASFIFKVFLNWVSSY